jgi:hypothetical protein
VHLADRFDEMSCVTTKFACMLCMCETHMVARQQVLTHLSVVNMGVVPVWSCCAVHHVLNHLLSRNAVVCLQCCALCETSAMQRQLWYVKCVANLPAYHADTRGVSSV